MKGKTTDQYYAERGYDRLLAKMDDASLRALKTVAIEKDSSIMEVTKIALERFLTNPGAFPKDFEEQPNGSLLKTFVPKELHKRVHIVATRDFGRYLGDLAGFVLSRWAIEQMGEAFNAITTQVGPETNTVQEKVSGQS
jgi:hypothetical protein